MKNNWKQTFSIVLLMGVFVFTAINLIQDKKVGVHADYYWEQPDGSTSYYQWVETNNPDIRNSKLVMIDDSVLKETRQPRLQESQQNKYIPQSLP